MKYTEKHYRQRVDAGAAMLDKHLPGWWKSGKINLKTLNVESCVNCVMGQLFGSYSDGMLWVKESCGGQYAARYGFSTGGPMGDYRLLTKLWVEVLTQRRLEAAREHVAANEKKYVLVA